MQPSRGSAVSDDDDGVGRDNLKLRAKFVVVANCFRLRDGEAGGKRRELHGRSGELTNAARGAVGLRDHQCNFIAGHYERIERGHGELWSPAEDEFHRTPMERGRLSFALSHPSRKVARSRSFDSLRSLRMTTARVGHPAFVLHPASLAMEFTTCLHAATCESCARPNRA